MKRGGWREGGREGGRDERHVCFRVCPILSSPAEGVADEEDEKADHFGMECVGGCSLALSLNHLNGYNSNSLP